MKIDFYILETTSRQKSSFFACRLLEKMYTEQPATTIYVHTNTREEAERFDALLWTYRDDSFLPHSLYNANDNKAPIQIGFGDAPTNSQNILLNLSQNIPAFYKQFGQVIEIVFTDAVVQQLARVRYKEYKDQGHDINTIKLKASEHD